jgi:hypothetical protein
MGLDTASLRFLFGARARGARFDETAMLGRQSIRIGAPALQAIFDEAGVAADAAAVVGEAGGYGEPIYRLLGARDVSSIDASNYEGATHLHDMNEPIPGALRERFSVVHDGGTLEHVFHFPQAMKNAMEMVSVGGHFIQVTVANNFMGHGLYQFSPELLFAIFSEENGFVVDAMLLHEVVPHGRWVRVLDPSRWARRVELVNHRRTFILTLAKKIARRDVFRTTPQQRYYEAIWRRDAQQAAPPPRPLLRRLAGRILPTPVKNAVKAALAARDPFASDLYVPLRERDIIRGSFG